MFNQNSLDTVCASLTYAMGLEAPRQAAPANPQLVAYINEMFSGEKVDRIFMYNPDAIAQWVYEKYGDLCSDLDQYGDVKVPLCTVMPCVTPVCFGTMYTGAQPAVHGIQSYTKPVITIDTLFDALIRAGKKPALISNSKASLGNIYLERDMDYFLTDGGPDAANAIAAELILADKHDFILVYNGNYDAKMHKFGPESYQALAELRNNVCAFKTLSRLISRNWKHHNTLVGFAMDHGCHEIDGGCGSHGLEMEEDMNIVHLYKGYKKEKA